MLHASAVSSEVGLICIGSRFELESSMRVALAGEKCEMMLYKLI